MLVTELYDGQGFGNQLWCYVVTRVLALDNGLGFGIQHPKKFKGGDFLKLDWGENVEGGFGPAGGPPVELPLGIKHYYSERVIRHPRNDVDIRMFDDALLEIAAQTKIDGVFQAEDYIFHRKEEIRDWLAYDTEKLDIDFSREDVCVINFRGGEYKYNPAVFLRRKYWLDAVCHMKSINPNMIFVVITDDPRLAKKFFPSFLIRHYGIRGDYQAINQAPHLILSNSSFGFFPAWLNSNLRVCFAPKYWAAHNDSDGYWACSYNMTRNWLYIDRDDKIFDFEQCATELLRYQDLHRHIYEQKKIANSFVFISSFNADLSWVPRYTDNYFVYERGVGSGLPPQLDRERVRFVSNNGSNFKDYFNYIIANYENLPDVVYLIKGNVFPRHVRQHVFDTYLNQNIPTSIIDRKVHRTKFPLDFFGKDGMYYELNTDWFVRTGVPWKYFQTLDGLLQHFDKSLQPKMYTRFSIGAEYIVSSEIIKRIPKSMYQDLLEIVSHGGLPIGYTAECYIVERAMDRLWQSKTRYVSDTDYRYKSLQDCSSAKMKKSNFKKLKFTAIGVIARILNVPYSFALLVCGVIYNRYKLACNFLSK